VGGFLNFPDPAKKGEMIHNLQHARVHALEFVEIFAKCPWELKRETQFVSLVGDNFDYLAGDLHSSNGDVILKKNFFHHLMRVVKPYSSATGFVFEGEGYLVGALSRLNLARHTLHPDTRRDCAAALARFPSTNIYDNNLAQSIEIVHCIDSSLAMLQKEEFKPEPLVQPPRTDGVGTGAIEAPRGTLYYNLVIAKGLVQEATLVIPTAQNQVLMEKDLGQLAQRLIDEGKEKEEIQHELEKLIRAYDPCMSCATHFLRVKWK
jgi:coenzyme F420-reducing hydrogenase alpha subunit